MVRVNSEALMATCPGAHSNRPIGPHMKTSAILAATLLTLAPLLHSAPESTAEPDARMAWWREARFGMFVHWGLYSGLAGNWNGNMVADHGGLEWIQSMVGADTYTYAAQAVPRFQPKPL